jgi:hypothetical protein
MIILSKIASFSFQGTSSINFEGLEESPELA